MFILKLLSEDVVVGCLTNYWFKTNPLLLEYRFGTTDVVLFSKVCAMVNQAISSGAKVNLGGGPSPVSNLHYEPTLLTDVSESMDLFQEEIFGPVVSVARFKTEEEALERANDCRTGLASYFYSNDVRQCWRVGKRLQTG